MQRDFDYESSNIIYDYNYSENGIKCKNYELCKAILPNWWYECKACYLCTNCDILFGTELEFTYNIDCNICFENNLGIKQLRCNHKICIECFRRCYYGDNNRDNEPIFPYPDIEDEYYNDQSNPKWDSDYPLIQKYNDEHNNWDDEREYKYLCEDYLRQCSICRR